MFNRVKAVLRGGLADDITVGLLIWTAWEIGRLSATDHEKRLARIKGRAEGFAEGTMDAYRRVMN